ncbi:WD40 repeat-like protein [Rhizodiscina lignyota]|uniref:WD40 repeat-like protein n=1 Tax=Rhizodiscina lignyota TaxID=1504668 RepID=A0A9P4IN34_9PEZI|nr:WD40 repeat-like protein [Rhizodiscina lignyota]
MEDVDDGDGDGDGDGDADMDADGDDGDNDDDEGENDNDEDDDQEDGESQPHSPSRSRRTSRPPPSSSLPNGTLSNGEASGTAASGPIVASWRPQVRPEALTAPVYDIVPTIAAPQGTSINTVTATPDMRWVFSGGSDGYIRKFNWPDTANGKLMLTVAQRHPFVDSVTKAGVLMSYWENEDSTVRTPPPHGVEDSTPTTPVYSLAVPHHALWLLSGGESGGINLQSVRHSEGTRITTLRQHTSAVSVLQLSEDEQSVLSGSWDKTILDWDLNTGKIKRAFKGSAGQISALEPRPLSTLPVPPALGVKLQTNGTFSSNNASRPRANGELANGTAAGSGVRPKAEDDAQAENEDAPGSPDDMNSLFGDDEDAGAGAPSLGLADDGAAVPGMDDDDDEFSRAIASGIQQEQAEAEEAQRAEAEMNATQSGGPVQPPDQSVSATDGANQTDKPDGHLTNGVADSDDVQNGLPHSEEPVVTDGANDTQDTSPPASDTTFLDAAIDGTIRVWDKRQPNPIARIIATSPWCMNACWSPDGNYIFAGRRNGTVDEYNLHKGLREPSRTFKFPGGSGPVSAVRAMPNGRHLICASYDILRLYDVKAQESSKHSVVPFLIVPGHRTGVISQLYIDPMCRFLISAAGNRGWDGASTEVLLGYEIGIGS